MFIVLGQRMVTVNKDKTTEAADAVLNMINDEVKLAQTLEDGYFRQFKVPRMIVGQEYNLSLDDYGLLTLTLDGKEYTKFLAQPMKGGFCFPNPLPDGYFNMTVVKENGQVSLSSCSICGYSYTFCYNAEAMNCTLLEATGLFPGLSATCCMDHCRCCP